MRSRILLLALSLGVLTAGGVSAAAHSASLSAVEVDVDEHAYVMPGVIKGGVVSMRFRNIGKELHEFAMGRIDEGHSFSAALRAFEQHKEARWLHDVAGPGILTPGAEITITRKLSPGSYFFIDGLPNTSGIPFEKLGVRRAFTVTGDSGRGSREPTQ